MLVLYKMTKPKIAGVLFVLSCLYFGSLAEPNYRLIIIKPDNVPSRLWSISVMVLHLGFLRRAALNDERCSAGLPLLEEDRMTSAGLAGSGLHELICLIGGDGRPDAVGNHLPNAAGAAGESGYAPNPAKARGYFLEASGNARLLRSVDGRRGLSGLIHSWPGNHAVYRYQSEGERILHAEGTPVCNRDLAVWIFDSVGGSDFLRDVLARANWAFFGPYEFWIRQAEALNNVESATCGGTDSEEGAADATQYPTSRCCWLS